MQRPEPRDRAAADRSAPVRPGSGPGAIEVVCALGILLAALVALTLALSYRLDQRRLGTIARREVLAGRPVADQAIQLCSWVHHNQGFRKNAHVFGWRRLGPLPVHVLEQGGDCSDKSRLLIALLRELGVSSTPVMCLDPAGVPSHTVVNVYLPEGREMILDPVWDLWFPAATAGSYHGLSDLRRDPTILDRRLAVVLETAAPNAKIRRYNRVGDAYDQATTYNWNKNRLTRTLAAVVSRLSGRPEQEVPRPALLEEPKLVLATVSALMGLASLVSWAGLRWARPRPRDAGPSGQPGRSSAAVQSLG